MLGFAPIAALPIADDAIPAPTSGVKIIASQHGGGTAISSMTSGGTRASGSIRSTVRIRAR